MSKLQASKQHSSAPTHQVNKHQSRVPLQGVETDSNQQNRSSLLFHSSPSSSTTLLHPQSLKRLLNSIPERIRYWIALLVYERVDCCISPSLVIPSEPSQTKMMSCWLYRNVQTSLSFFDNITLPNCFYSEWTWMTVKCVQELENRGKDGCREAGLHSLFSTLVQELVASWCLSPGRHGVVPNHYWYIFCTSSMPVTRGVPRGPIFWPPLEPIAWTDSK